MTRENLISFLWADTSSVLLAAAATGNVISPLGRKKKLETRCAISDWQASKLFSKTNI